jgi:ABC-type glutathione transport system ATPase component
MTCAPPDGKPGEVGRAARAKPERSHDRGRGAGRTPSRELVAESESPPPALALRGVAKGYGRGAARRPVLAGVNFALAQGELVAIVGFSGTGKTTLLSILAGLLAPDAGSIEMDGRPAPAAGPERGVVFQSYALLPSLTVLGNVQLAVDAVRPDLSRTARREHALDFVRLVGLEAAHAKRPRELSGGMRQRVAVARALATPSPAPGSRSRSRGSSSAIGAAPCSSPTTSTRRSCSPTASCRSSRARTAPGSAHPSASRSRGRETARP